MKDKGKTKMLQKHDEIVYMQVQLKHATWQSNKVATHLTVEVRQNRLSRTLTGSLNCNIAERLYGAASG